MSFGTTLRRRRQELGLSQSELSRAAGINVRQLARYEHGQNEPPLTIAAKLADVLNLTLDQLAATGPTDAELDAALDRVKDIPIQPREDAWR
ncbi:MAG: helix-turn-helix transcriptional regulator [Acidobacteriota bacterium]|nr:helix-turn-helix transcriptional regulator [Acidobacteriota bacterium]